MQLQNVTHSAQQMQQAGVPCKDAEMEAKQAYAHHSKGKLPALPAAACPGRALAAGAKHSQAHPCLFVAAAAAVVTAAVAPAVPAPAEC